MEVVRLQSKELILLLRASLLSLQKAAQRLLPSNLRPKPLLLRVAKQSKSQFHLIQRKLLHLEVKPLQLRLVFLVYLYQAFK